MNGAMKVHQVPAASDNLVWIIECVATREAGVVDGPGAGEALELCEARGLKLTTVLNTHTHFDHIGVNNDLDRRGLLNGMRVFGPALVAADVPGITDLVSEGDVVAVGDCQGRVMVTEGHINGHVSFVFGDVLFCGDTLFTGGCGYLFDGPPEVMFDSLLRLAALPGETRVCCAHEYTQDNLRFAYMVEPDNPLLVDRIRHTWTVRSRGGCVVPSTVELERATNPFLRPGSPELLRIVGEMMPDRVLADPAAVFAATRALKDGGAHKVIPDADLPLG